MAFFINLFDQEYQGYLVLADRKLSPTFKVDPNKNLQSQQIAWNAGPYDLSVDKVLEFNFSWDINFKTWTKVQIDVSGTNPAATSVNEVVSALNSDPMFSSMLIAKSTELEGEESVLLTRKKSKNFKFYFSNSGAEKHLKFNKNAGFGELPNYFERHTVENANNYADSAGILIKLDETDPVDQAVISSFGYDPLNMKEDWELLEGRGPGLFTFKKSIVDGSGRITETIEYPAGAKVGDFARKIKYTYSGSGANPVQVAEIPYVLQNGDLINP